MAQQGDIAGAVARFQEALTFDPSLTVNPDAARYWNALCWFGATWNHASLVLDACERAVTLSDGNPNFRDSRGVARALTGDTAGAIEDFEAFVTWTKGNGKYETDGKQREGWIAALEAGKNPFDEETLKALRSE